VLFKLKNLNKNGSKRLTRCQTAKVMSEVKPLRVEEGKIEN
jgi:hypothetical protein